MAIRRAEIFDRRAEIFDFEHRRASSSIAVIRPAEIFDFEHRSDWEEGKVISPQFPITPLSEK
ncbi:MAG: hypothetical protein AB4426_07685 [Xenococcaceae cyanobacterium]